MPRLTRSLAVFGLLALQRGAAAQPAPPPYDPAIELQLLDVATGPKSFFATTDTALVQRRQLALDAFFTFLTDPFVIYDVAPGVDQVEAPRTRVVTSLSVLELGAAWGLSDRLQLGVALPVAQVTGDGIDPATAMAAPGGLAETGAGDLRLEAKWFLAQRGALRLGTLAAVTLPTSFGSGGSDFLGDDLPSLRGKLVAQWSAGRLSLGANAGVVLRKPRELYATEIGPQATWAGAAALRLTERFFLLGEAFGRTGLISPGVDGSPVELSGAMRVFVTSSVALVGGGGGGVVSGVGAPKLRVFASLAYSPDVRDSDKDGIPNGRDPCPLEPEDRDGWQDTDGCPEGDNDSDQRADATDKCPTEAEDKDGWQDDDGCPEPDNDGDGIADLEDKCPADPEDKVGQFSKDGCPVTKHDADGDELVDAIDQCVVDAEDMDGFEDGDGCPDDDQDKDGVADADDACALCAEDMDGFEDGDGCPEGDNDADGIADAKDQCPAEAEVVNAVDDFDGCPDEGGVTVASYDGERILLLRAPPFDRKGLTKAGELIVDQVALVMLAHPEVTQWLVALADPKERYAQRRAEQVRDRLSTRGVARERLEVMSAKGSEKLVAVARERADESIKICPTPEVAPRPDRQERRALPTAAETPTGAAR